MTGYPKPEYTQVPNELFEVDMKNMSEAELKCTLAIIRKIIGFHKDRPEPISITQLREMTGLSRQAVLDGTAAALQRGRIKLAGKGKRGVSLYTVNFVDQSEIQTSTSPQNRPDLVYPVDTQKKESKETPKTKEVCTSSDSGTLQTLKENADALSEEQKNTEKRTEAESTHESHQEPTPKPKPSKKATASRPRDPIFDAIAECAWNLTPGTALGKSTAARIGMARAEVVTTYPNITPEQIREAFRKGKPYTPQDPAKIIALLAKHMPAASAPPQMRVINPDCPMCGGTGLVRPEPHPFFSDKGVVLACPACEREAEQHGRA